MLFPSPHSGGPEPRVVITGAGIITALGLGWKANSERFRSGTPAFRPITLFDVSRHRVRTAAELELPADAPKTRLPASQVARLDRASSMLLWAATEAWNQSGWLPAEELPLVLGTTSGGMSLGEAYYRQVIETPIRRKNQARRVLHYQPQRQARILADAFGLGGPVTIIANACASGANAIGHATDLIRSGTSERVLTGGYDALSEMVFSGFDSLQALSPTQCRPFDAHRDGLALGEGAAVMALESLEYARKRGAVILGEVCGYCATTDVHHLTQPHPNGDAALAAMNGACQSARVNPSAIGYVNAHGTGTPLNDSAEAAAINSWAGAHARALPVSSTKSCVGHLLGAAGAVEAVVCVMALREGWLPPTTTLAEPEPVCGFPVVREPRDAAIDYALTNSFGFGGANASLVLRRWG